MQEIQFGRSRVFREAVEKIDNYAISPWPLLLLGETGVGKELLARRAHALSPRRHHPFIPINCGAMPPSLFESELFGHEKGAFSGADHASRGLLRTASGGTVFLDEIGDLELSSQVKLLRFLDQGEIRSVGSYRFERVDVRIIAATNVDLHSATGQGRFRRDLLERLSVLTVRIPTLRERSEDIPLLAERIVREIGGQSHGADFDCLKEYPWPGNVRQLRNCLIRAFLSSRGNLSRASLERVLDEEGASALAMNTQSFLNGSLEEIERRVIIARLLRCHGNRKKTAKDLGIAKSTLHEKLRRWKLEEISATLPRPSAAVARPVSHQLGL